MNDVLGVTVAGLVLAAGAGRRFGGAKQLALLEGRPLVRHAVDAVLAVGDVRPVVVVLGAEADAVRATLPTGDVTPVLCDDWAEGMAASLRAGVAALHDPDWALVLLADQPGVDAAAIRRVVAAARAAPPGTAAVRARHAGTPGHPVALSRAVLCDVPALRGDVGARDLLVGREVVDVDAGPQTGVDVDTRDDLEALRVNPRR